MSQQGKVNISGQWEVAVRKVQEALAGADPQGKEFAYFNFDVKTAVNPDDDANKRKKIFFAIKVLVPKSGRAVAANRLTRNLTQVFPDAVASRDNQQIDIPIAVGGLSKSIRVEVKPEAGGGSGGGASETQRNECAQCLYAALAFYVYRGHIDPTKIITEEDFQEAAKYIDIDAKLEEIYGDALDLSWHHSSIKGANKLWDVFGRNAGNKRYTFCRGGGPDDKEIKKAFQRVNAQMKKDPNIRVTFSSEDKWNPADIWMVDNSLDMSQLDALQTVDDINNFIKVKYESKELIGVSLKRIAGRVKMQVLNYRKDARSLKASRYGFKKYDLVYKTSSKKDNKDNYPMDAYLYYYTGGYDKFQSRNFGDTKGSWQLELKAASAAGGRAGGGSVTTILDSLGVSYVGLTSGYENTTFHQHCDPKNKTHKKRITEDILELLKKYNASGLPKDDSQTIGEIANRNQSWRYSKLLSLRLLDCISTSGKGDEIMRALYLYAASQSDKSSVYVKLMD